MISHNDRILRGIYRFEGDRLVICQQSKPEEPRPDTFEARAGSGRMRVRLKLASDLKRASRTGFPRNEKGRPGISAGHGSNNAQTHQADCSCSRLFKGNWDIVSILDDGQSLGPELIRQRFAQSGRVQLHPGFATTSPGQRNGGSRPIVSTRRRPPARST